MKDENFGTPKSSKYPDVDRSSKANAIKSYDKNMAMIRERQLELADKQLKVNKEILAEAEKESQDPSNNEVESLKFKLMEKVDQERDYVGNLEFFNKNMKIKTVTL